MMLLVKRETITPLVRKLLCFVVLAGVIGAAVGCASVVEGTKMATDPTYKAKKEAEEQKAQKAEQLAQWEAEEAEAREAQEAKSAERNAKNEQLIVEAAEEREAFAVKMAETEAKRQADLNVKLEATAAKNKADRIQREEAKRNRKANMRADLIEMLKVEMDLQDEMAQELQKEMKTKKAPEVPPLTAATKLLTALSEVTSSPSDCIGFLGEADAIEIKRELGWDHVYMSWNCIRGLLLSVVWVDNGNGTYGWAGCGANEGKCS